VDQGDHGAGAKASTDVAEAQGDVEPHEDGGEGDREENVHPQIAATFAAVSTRRTCALLLSVARIECRLKLFAGLPMFLTFSKRTRVILVRRRSPGSRSRPNPSARGPYESSPLVGLSFELGDAAAGKSTP
jgi:hypothetical protein